MIRLISGDHPVDKLQCRPPPIDKSNMLIRLAIIALVGVSKKVPIVKPKRHPAKERDHWMPTQTRKPDRVVSGTPTAQYESNDSNRGYNMNANRLAIVVAR